MTVGRLDVFSAAAVAMSAGAYLVVKTAVDFVLLCTEDGSEVGSHIVSAPDE